MRLSILEGLSYSIHCPLCNKTGQTKIGLARLINGEPNRDPNPYHSLEWCEKELNSEQLAKTFQKRAVIIIIACTCCASRAAVQNRSTFILTPIGISHWNPLEFLILFIVANWWLRAPIWMSPPDSRQPFESWEKRDEGRFEAIWINHTTGEF